MKKKKERKRTRVLKNNLYALKLGWKIAPELVIHMAVARVLGYFEWLFYSAFFMRYVINALETEQEVTSIFIFLGVTVTVFASMTLYNQYLEGKVWPIASAKVHKKLNLRLFEKSTNVELSCFEDSEFYNKYTLATEGAAEKLIDTISNIWGVLFGSIAAVLAFYLMYDIDKLSVLFVVFPIIGNFVFNRKVGQIDFNRNKDMAPHNRRTAYVNRVMYLAEYAKEVRLTNVFSLMRRDYREAIKGVADVTKKYSLKAVILHWFYVQFTFSFIFEGVLIYGAYRTLVNDSMSLAKLAVLTSMMVSCTWILIGFTDYLAAGFKNGLFVDNLRNFLEYEEKIPEDYPGDDPGDTIESIEFKNVCFSYKDEEVIKDLSFELRGGKTYALVGHNGAGKSTIIKLLMRFYDPTSGEIFLNGRNIKEYELQKYRALFAGAFQDYQIFSLSVLENVLMRKATEGDEEEAVRALKLAGVYEKVESLPNGIQTILTKEFAEDGAVLSGGEYQKIVVARAFVQKRPVKIFDEPSSALDPIAEYQLFESILKDGQDKTMLFISHRLSSVQNADWVFMLENGTIIEQGSHKKLMANHGAYADMYEKQAVNYLATDRTSLEGSFFAADKEVAE
ncbi:MAG: ABC transporter ATP-binding protein [Lachnospiraceae bacterium]|nr:ABC transporter ATP-binding protein [Lachnospiraceae bacterium]